MSGHAHGGHTGGHAADAGGSHGHDCGHAHDGSHAHDGGHAHSNLRQPLLEGDGCCGGHGHDVEHGHGHAHGHGHGHGHSDSHDETDDDQRRLKMAVYCALFFMLVEIFGGIVANSLAIITDAAHMLSDVGGFIVSLMALKLSVSGATETYTYGFKQAEVLGALLSIAIVWALTAVLLWEAVPRFIQPEEIDAPVMFWISVIGFVVNLILMKVLGHGHAHGGDDHGHSHGHGDGEGGGVALQAAMAHVIGDIVQSLGVCAASLCIWMKPLDIGEVCTTQASGEATCVSKWNYADPMCTVLFSILVLYTTKSTMKRAVATLMHKVPDHINHAKFFAELSKINGVDSVHDLHLWSLGSKDVLCTAHIVVKTPGSSTDALQDAIKLAQKSGIGHSTFQIEIKGEFDRSLENFDGCYDSSPKQGGSVGHGHSH